VGGKGWVLQGEGEGKDLTAARRGSRGEVRNRPGRQTTTGKTDREITAKKANGEGSTEKKDNQGFPSLTGHSGRGEKGLRRTSHKVDAW